MLNSTLVTSFKVTYDVINWNYPRHVSSRMDSEFVVSDVVGGRELDGLVGHLLDQLTMITGEVAQVRKISFGQNQIVMARLWVLVCKEKMNQVLI